ncbi:MAG: glutamine--fructose-6-phosphate transaminase (isomerizing), partial [Roseivirga sp.]|nr:glutamine--fructose-6-phosphate transaminase (isomerizing) [Roseivirga sp.]
MCGIVGYIGHRQAYSVVVKGLQRLEYRGYDSAGVALLDGDLNVYKKQGKVATLHDFAKDQDIDANVGIGHTRWATHGVPSDRNAHPHVSNSGRLVMIHNGIIENYAAIKTELSKKGYTFNSDTDSEVFINFIEDIFQNTQVDLAEAVRLALTKVVGAYAIVILDKDNPDLVIAARKGSPLVVGLGKDEFFLASDATPIIEYTNEVVYLDDQEIAIIENKKLTIKNIEDVEMKPYIQKVDMELEAIEKGGYEHFMLKEIFEQPRSIGDCLRGRLNAQEGHLHLGGIHDYINKIKNADRILIIACGTSWHAGLVAEYIFEEFCRIPVEVEYASEFRYRN